MLKYNNIMDNLEEQCWIGYITTELKDNYELYFEIEINELSDTTFIPYRITFDSGKYTLPSIPRPKLLKYIKKSIELKFNNCQYLISTRNKC